MYIRQILAQRHLHPQICITAFIATTISGLILTLPAFSQTPIIAIAANVLLLVLGFPLINPVADLCGRGDVDNSMGATRMGIIDFLLALMQDMILSSIPTVEFEIVFNVPHRALLWCALLGC